MHFLYLLIFLYCFFGGLAFKAYGASCDLDDANIEDCELSDTTGDVLLDTTDADATLNITTDISLANNSDSVSDITLQAIGDYADQQDLNLQLGLLEDIDNGPVKFATIDFSNSADSTDSIGDYTITFVGNYDDTAEKIVLGGNTNKIQRLYFGDGGLADSVTLNVDVLELGDYTQAVVSAKVSSTGNVVIDELTIYNAELTSIDPDAGQSLGNIELTINNISQSSAESVIHMGQNASLILNDLTRYYNGTLLLEEDAELNITGYSNGIAGINSLEFKDNSLINSLNVVSSISNSTLFNSIVSQLDVSEFVFSNSSNVFKIDNLTVVAGTNLNLLSGMALARIKEGDMDSISVGEVGSSSAYLHIINDKGAPSTFSLSNLTLNTAHSIVDLQGQENIAITDYNNDHGANLFIRAPVTIDNYSSNGGRVSLFFYSPDDFGDLTVDNVVSSTDDTFGLVANVVFLTEGEPYEVTIFSAPIAAFDQLISSEDEISSDFMAVFLTKDGTLKIGKLHKNSNNISYNITTDGSNKFLKATIQKNITLLADLDPLPDEEGSVAEFSDSIQELKALLDTLLIPFPDSLILKDLRSMVSTDLLVGGGLFLESLLPISNEVFLLDVNSSSNILLDSITLQARNSMKLREGSLWLNPVFTYSTIKNQQLVVGNSGYKGFLQIGTDWYLTSDESLREDMHLALSTALVSGFGTMSNDEDIRGYELSSTVLGVHAALQGQLDNILGGISLGFTYNIYDTKRHIALIEEYSTVAINGSDVSSYHSQADFVVQDVMLGVEGGMSLIVPSVGTFVPKIYYRGNIVIFDSYEEEGSIANLYVYETEQVLVSDTGVNLEMDFQAFKLGNSSTLLSTVGIDLGYKYYSIDDLEYTFSFARSTSFTSSMFSYEYKGVYIKPKIALNIDTASLVFGINYSADILFKGVTTHALIGSISYTF